MSEERELSPERVAALAAEGAQLVDVREDEEFEAGHVPGSVNVVLPDLPAHAPQLDRDRPVVFVCRSGNRSRMAAEAFASDGWDAHNLAGGARAWAQEGRPLEPEGGAVIERRPLPPA